MNLAACGSLKTTAEHAVWFRLVPTGHLKTALSSAHTRLAQSRFNGGSLLRASARYATLYFSDDPTVAQFEAGAVLGSLTPGGHIPHPHLSFVSLNVHINLNRVVDLTDMSAQASLDTTAQELTGDWQGYQTRSSRTHVKAPRGLAPTQTLGQALFNARFEGFRAISAKVPYHKSLIVFPDNLMKGSSLTFEDDAGGVVHHVP